MKRYLYLIGLTAVIATPNAQQVQSWRLSQDMLIDAEKEDLHSTLDVFISPGRSVAVAQPFDRQVRLYDSAGRRVAVLGRRGEGPGEFQEVSRRQGWSGDTLWVFDRLAQRISLFASNTYVRFEELRPRTVAPSALAAPLGRLPGGIFVAQFSPSNRGPDSAFRAIIATVDLSGAVRRELVRIPRIQSALTVATASGPRFVTIPYMTDPIADVSVDGTKIVWITSSPGAGGRVTVNVNLIRASGDTLYQRTLDMLGVRIPRAVADSTLAAEIQRTAAPEQKRAIDTEVRRRMPSTFPLVENAFVALDGKVWMQVRTADSGRGWRVLDINGIMIAQLDSLPSSLALMDADGSHVWASRNEPSGLVSVVRFRIDSRR